MTTRAKLPIGDVSRRPAVAGLRARGNLFSLFAFCVALGCGAGSAASQASAEYASTLAKMGQSKSATAAASPPVAAKGNGSTHLPLAANEPPEIVNRRKLEDKAGEDAAKVLFRSIPPGAQVWIDGLFVGTTPLLLVLAPGGYAVEMRGDRTDAVKEKLTVLPRKSQEMEIRLPLRYPAQIRLK